MVESQTFMQLGANGEPKQEFFLFAWRDGKGGCGDYGLNEPPVSQTMRQLIQTTYVFQDAPAFTLYCRPVQLTQAQFEYLLDHDLDTEAFFEQQGLLSPSCYEIDLAQYKDGAAALDAMEKICGA